MLYRGADDKKIFHVHIPRNAGRYVRQIFIENSFDYYHGEYKLLVYGIETPHLHYPLYLNLELVEESEHFVVVRNPFDRFKSSMQIIIRARHYPEEIYEKIQDKDWLFNFLDMEKMVGSYKTNFYRDQKDFISEKTKIWKLENGLNLEFVQWLNNNLNLSLKISNEIKYDLMDAELVPIKQKINPIVEDYIKEYYAEDYEFFNY